MAEDTQYQRGLHSMKGELGTAMMAGGLVAGGNEILKMVEKKEDASLPTAALGAGAAYAGYKMAENATNSHVNLPRRFLVHDHHHKSTDHDIEISRGRSWECDYHRRSHRSLSTCSRYSNHELGRRGSSTPPHHRRHLLEEALGLYGLTREVMGDKRHHILHVLEEVVGVMGMIKDLSEKDH